MWCRADAKSPLRNKDWLDLMVRFALHGAKEGQERERTTAAGGNQRDFDLQKYSQSVPEASFFKSRRVSRAKVTRFSAPAHKQTPSPWCWNDWHWSRGRSLDTSD